MDMDLLGHDFYVFFHLFAEIETGHHQMIRRLTDGRNGLRGGPADAVPVGTVVRVVLEGPAESLTPEQAGEHLDTGGDRFAFHIDPTSQHRVTPQ